MSNIDAINQAPGGIAHAAAATTLIRQKPNPWFNVLAAVVIVAGIIYTGIHLADDLSVVRDTRAYPYILLGIALLIALGFEQWATVRNLLMAWVLTLPVSIALAGLYWLLRNFL
jgi:phosphate/sulfate permease